MAIGEDYAYIGRIVCGASHPTSQSVFDCKNCQASVRVIPNVDKFHFKAGTENVETEFTLTKDQAVQMCNHLLHYIRTH